MGSLRETQATKNNEKYDQEIKEFTDSLDAIIHTQGRYTIKGNAKALEWEFGRVLRYLNNRPYRVRRGCYDAIMLRELSLQRLGFVIEDNLLGISEKRQKAKSLWTDPRTQQSRGIAMNWTVNGK
jgi:hypothetical protein